MGRNKKDNKDKRVTVSIQIPNELLECMSDVKNKSKFFEWLLEQHFN